MVDFDQKFTPEAVTAHWYKCTKNLQPEIGGLLIVDICLGCLHCLVITHGIERKENIFLQTGAM